MEFRILNSSTLSLFKLFLPLIILFSCTKEVKIDIPGYEEQLVIDGSIETGKKPLVLLSKTANIYAATNIEAYLNSFVEGANITVSDGSNTITLDLAYTDELPQSDLIVIGESLGFSDLLLANVHMPVYYGLNGSLVGEAGKNYTLNVNLNGNTYTATTAILPPTQLVDLFWKPDGNYTDRGFSWAKLSDAPGTYDAYKWQVKRLNAAYNDDHFFEPFNPYYDDTFFDGKTFEFSYENPMTCRDDFEPEDLRCYYVLGDTVVVKYSKLDAAVYEFMEKKYNQIYSAGNPFATPLNIPTNIKGGALGIWAGYSPTYDTLICAP
jgi:hypothetical protein